MANIVMWQDPELRKRQAFGCLKRFSRLHSLRWEDKTIIVGQATTGVGIFSCIERERVSWGPAFQYSLSPDWPWTQRPGCLLLLLPHPPSSTDCALKLWSRTKRHSLSCFCRVSDHSSKAGNYDTETQNHHKNKMGSHNLYAQDVRLKQLPRQSVVR